MRDVGERLGRAGKLTAHDTQEAVAQIVALQKDEDNEDQHQPEARQRPHQRAEQLGQCLKRRSAGLGEFRPYRCALTRWCR